MLRALAAMKPHMRRVRRMPRGGAGGAAAGRARAAAHAVPERDPQQAEHARGDERLAPAVAATAIHVAIGGASISPRLTPAWFTALPSARSAGLRYSWMALPAAGMPAASAAPSTARHPTSPASPRVKPVAMPAQRPDRPRRS